MNFEIAHSIMRGPCQTSRTVEAITDLPPWHITCTGNKNITTRSN